MGSKIDKTQARAVKYEEGKALADRYGAGFCEVSSKTRENVKTPFIETVERILADPELAQGKKKAPAAVNLEPDDKWETEGGGGCVC